MAKPKLLVLASTFPRNAGDGTPGFVLDLAIEQTRSFDVTVLTPHVPGAMRTQVIEGVKVIRYRYWPFAQRLADGSILDNLRQRPQLWQEVPFLFIGLALALVKNISGWKPDAIHAHWIIPQGLVAAIFKGKTKLLVTAHGGDIYALNGGSLKNLKQWALGRAEAITTVNNEMQQRLLDWGISGAKIQVLPMGSDFSKFQGAADSRTSGSAVAVGRLVEKKGFDVLIDAIRHGIGKGKLPKEFHLTIAGDGPLRQSLEQQARNLPISFVGNQTQDQIAQLLAEAEMFIIPSRIAASGDREGLPVTLMEAAAASCFVIASNLSGISDLVVDGETGMLVPPEDFKALSKAMSKAFSDPGYRARCSKLLNASAQNFDIKTIGAKYSSLIEGLR